MYLDGTGSISGALSAGINLPFTAAVGTGNQFNCPIATYGNFVPTYASLTGRISSCSGFVNLVGEGIYPVAGT